jgi:hypothetical protein
MYTAISLGAALGRRRQMPAGSTDGLQEMASVSTDSEIGAGGVAFGFFRAFGVGDHGRRTDCGEMHHDSVS